MKNIIAFLCLTFVFFQSCKEDCDPGLLPENEILYLNILNPDGSSFIKYPGNAIPDSVKVLNLGTNTLVTRFMIKDSILVIEGYDKTNSAITNFKISKGTILKPDTVQVTAVQKSVEDNCGSIFSVARINQVKVNNIIKCTACVYNTVLTYQR